MDKINPSTCLIKGCFYWPSKSVENDLFRLQQDQSLIKVRLEKKYKDNIYTVVYIEHVKDHSSLIFYFENIPNSGRKKLLFISYTNYLPTEWDDITEEY